MKSQYRVPWNRCEQKIFSLFIWELLLLEEGPNLHAHSLQWMPGAFKIHPYDSIVCSVPCHIWCIQSIPVVSAIWIGWMTAIIPPTTSIFFSALFFGVCGPVRKKIWNQWCWSRYLCNHKIVITLSMNILSSPNRHVIVNSESVISCLNKIY